MPIMTMQSTATIDLGDLARVWRQLEFLAARAEEISTSGNPRDLTSVKVDQSRPGGHRLYPLVEQHLRIALDAHHALKVVLAHHGLTQVAPWCLLRAQFEASARAAWLLAPEDSTDRVSRAVHMEWGDGREADRNDREALRDVLMPIPQDERERELAALAARSGEHDGTYRAELAALGLRSRPHPSQFTVVDAVGVLDDDHPEFRLLLRRAWRLLAGLQHGSMSAWLRITDRLGEVEIPGGMRLHLTPNEDSTNQLCTVTAGLTITALDTYMERHRRLGPNPVDLAGVAFYRRATA